MTAVKNVKAALRQEIADRRAAISTAKRAEADTAIAERFFAKDWNSTGEVGLYWSTSQEVSTRDIVSRLCREGRRVHWPRLTAEPLGLEFAAADESELVKNRWGIFEPPPELPKSGLDALGLLLIPGVAFDVSGRRLGRGQGYYDRLLETYRGLRIALAYDFQVLPELPAEDHDEGVDWVVTETRVIDCQKKM